MSLAMPARVFALVLVVTATLYADVVRHPFELDDFHSVVENPAVHGLNHLKGVWTSPTAVSALGRGAPGYRPLLMTSFAVQYELAGADPWSYHAVNLVLHLVVVGLTWILAATCSPDRRVALVAASLVALHPIQTEAVNYASARSTLLVTVLLLGALIGMARAMDGQGVRRWMWATGAVFAVALAVTVKEIAVMAPAFWGLWAWYRADGRDSGMRLVWWTLPFVAVVAGFLVVYYSVLGSETMFAPERPSLLIAAATTTKIIAKSLSAWVWPLPLSIDHGRVLVGGTAAAIAWVIGGAVVFAITWRMVARGRRAPFFALAWTSASVLPVGAAVFIADVGLYQESRAYPVGIGLALAVAPTIVRGLDVARARLGLRPVLAMVVAVAIAAGTTVAIRTATWADSVTLWQDAVSDYPDSAEAHVGLGSAYVRAGRRADAETSFREAVRLAPDAPGPAYQLARFLTDTGRIEEGMALHQRIAERVLGGARLAALRGDLLWNQGNVAGAEIAYREAEERGLADADLFAKLGVVYERQGRISEALRAYQRSLASHREGYEAEDRKWHALARDGIERLRGPARQAIP